MATQSTSDKTRAKKIVAVECADDECDSHLCDPFRQTLETSIATAISEARAEMYPADRERLEDYNKIGGLPAVVKSVDCGAESLAQCVEMAIDRHHRLGKEEGSRVARTEVWKEAILLVDTAPGYHSAGKWYIDPVALIQRMNAALQTAKEGVK